MTHKVTISDGTILEKCVQSVYFNTDPPPDDFYDMRDFTIKSMTITGKIGAEKINTTHKTNNPIFFIFISTSLVPLSKKP
jgi:hypothetical protein